MRARIGMAVFFALGLTSVSSYAQFVIIDGKTKGKWGSQR